jgi:hypothetical protein
MNPRGKKFISLFLVFSLLMINCATLSRLEERREKRKKHGANLIIQKINGQQVSGELITVKPSSLLLLNTEGKDVSVDIEDVRVIKIVRRSKFLKGARPGALIGLTAGVLIGIKASQEETEYNIVTLPIMPIIEIAKASAPFVYGFVYMTFGALIGGIVGVAVGDKTIELEAMSDLEREEALEKLRKKARIRDYK